MGQKLSSHESIEGQHDSEYVEICQECEYDQSNYDGERHRDTKRDKEIQRERERERMNAPRVYKVTKHITCIMVRLHPALAQHITWHYFHSGFVDPSCVFSENPAGFSAAFLVSRAFCDCCWFLFMGIKLSSDCRLCSSILINGSLGSSSTVTSWACHCGCHLHCQ